MDNNKILNLRSINENRIGYEIQNGSGDLESHMLIKLKYGWENYRWEGRAGWYNVGIDNIAKKLLEDLRLT